MKKLLATWIVVFLLFSLILISAASASPDWCDSSFAYRKQINILHVNASGSTLTNYPAYINVTNVTGMEQVDWDDRYFYDSNCNLMAWELENYTNGYGDYWLNVTSLATTGTSVWLYYSSTTVGDAEDPEGVWDSYTMMVQHLQEAPANDIPGHLDSTSNNNDGTPKNFNGTATSTTDAIGKIDGADVFDGIDDYVDCGNDSSLNFGTGNFSVGFWIKTLDYDCEVISKSDPTETEWFFQIQEPSGRINFQIVDMAAPAEVVTHGVAVVNNNAWHHIVGIRAGSTFRSYVDGDFDDEADEPLIGNLDTNDNLTIGFSKIQGGYFNGTIDEVRISSTVRSADWINQSYQLVTNQSTFVKWGSVELPLVPSAPEFNMMGLILLISMILIVTILLKKRDR